MRRPILIIAAVLIVPMLILLIGYLLLQDDLRGGAIPPEPALVQIVDDSLDVLNETAWSLQPGWTYIARVDRPGMALMAVGDASPMTYGSDVWGDVVVEVTFWADAGECRLSVRDSAAGRYTLALGADNLVTLYRDETELGSEIASAVLSGPPWHRLRLSAIGGILRVAVDGEDSITAGDPDPLPPGQIVFGLGEALPAGCTLGSLAVWVPES
jgi:hypothetical protein